MWAPVYAGVCLSRTDEVVKRLSQHVEQDNDRRRRR